MPREPGGPDPLEAMRPGTLRGTPEQVLEQLAALAQAGVARVMLQHLTHTDLEVLELIGSRVIPEAERL
jgi:alkanesulfonate monooxygenase SsuD/methylene tetrahydromethanopterin reductase-like flavin-dependent oxidoreductase (luciferase family)